MRQKWSLDSLASESDFGPFQTLISHLPHPRCAPGVCPEQCAGAALTPPTRQPSNSTVATRLTGPVIRMVPAGRLRLEAMTRGKGYPFVECVELRKEKGRILFFIRHASRESYAAVRSPD